MFIFGWGYRTFKKYGTIKHQCTHCRQETQIDLIKVTLWLTFFFIPVIPTSRRYLLMCFPCKGIEEVNKEEFLEYVTQVLDPSEVKPMTSPTHHHTQHGFKTETQLNYIKEMEAFEKEKERKEKLNNQKKSKIEKLIEKSERPITKEVLIKGFQELGLKKNMHVLVHSSLSAFGWVNGGAVTIIHALQEMLSEEGTIVMPTHSADYSDPINWENPPVPKEWQETIKETMPVFKPEETPTRGMGVIPELFRTFPDVSRSYHPHYSFAAWGKNRLPIIEEHALSNGLSLQSPLGKLYALEESYVLLLGVNYENNTSFHLAEYLQPKVKEVLFGAPILEEGVRVWKEFKDIELECDDFEKIGEAYETTGQVKKITIGLAQCRLFPMKDAVNFAIKWILENREG